MGGSNFGRSHEPQQCGGAHLPNTLSSGALQNTPAKKDEARNPKGVSKPRLFA